MFSESAVTCEKRNNYLDNFSIKSKQIPWFNIEVISDLPKIEFAGSWFWSLKLVRSTLIQGCLFPYSQEILFTIKKPSSSTTCGCHYIICVILLKYILQHMQVPLAMNFMIRHKIDNSMMYSTSN